MTDKFTLIHPYGDFLFILALFAQNRAMNHCRNYLHYWCKNMTGLTDLGCYLNKIASKVDSKQCSFIAKSINI